MHGSWGNLISAEDAFERMGADVMRWHVLAPAADPEHPVRLRAGRRDQAPAADAVELGLASSSTTPPSRASSRATRISTGDVAGVELRSLDRWLLARMQQLVAEAEAAYDAYLTVDVVGAFESFLEDLSNWYIRRSRRRFYSSDEAAFRDAVDRARAVVRVFAPVHAVPRRAPVAALVAEPPRMPPRRCSWRAGRASRRRRGRGAARRDRTGAARSSSSGAARARRPT